MNRYLRRSFSLKLMGSFVFLTLYVYQGVAQEPFFRYDTFMAWDGEKFALQNFSLALQRDKQSVGYIIFYTGEKYSFKKTLGRINRSRNYLIKQLHIKSSRIKIIYAGDLGYVSTTILQPLNKNEPPPYSDVRKNNE